MLPRNRGGKGSVEAYGEAVSRFCREQGLLTPGQRVLAAFSGGADSCAMVILLEKLAKEWGLSLCAAHVHHGLRGAEADRDARFCKEFCEQRGIPFLLLQGDATAEAAAHGTGPEEAARTLRYRLLRQAADAFQADRIATAHTADDQVETVLLHLIRGGGLRGLCGIPPENGGVIRPILPLTRKDTEAVAHFAGIRFMEDSTNVQPICGRNRLRQAVMPTLRELNPALGETVLENSLLLRQEEEYLEQLAQERLADAGRENGIACEALVTAPAVLARRMLRAYARGQGVTLSRERTEAALAFAKGAGSGTLDLGQGAVLRREFGSIRLMPREDTEPPEPVMLPLDGGEVRFGKWRVTLRTVDTETRKPETVYKLFNHCVLDCATITGNLWIRTPRTGDRFAKNKNSGTKLLSRLLADRKVPADQRKQLPVVADAQGLVWVMGIGANAMRYGKKFGKSCFEIVFTDDTIQ